MQNLITKANAKFMQVLKTGDVRIIYFLHISFRIPFFRAYYMNSNVTNNKYWHTMIIPFKLHYKGINQISQMIGAEDSGLLKFKFN